MLNRLKRWPRRPAPGADHDAWFSGARCVAHHRRGCAECHHAREVAEDAADGLTHDQPEE